MTALDETVLALFGPLGVSVRPYGESGLYIGDPEVGLVVVPDHTGSYRVLREHRGVLEGPLLTGASWTVVEHFVAMYEGRVWRMHHGWSPLKPGGVARCLPPGSQIVDIEEDAATLVIEGNPPFRLHGLTAEAAHWVAWAVVTPLDDLIASIRDPQGRPAFPLEDATAEDR